MCPWWILSQPGGFQQVISHPKPQWPLSKMGEQMWREHWNLCRWQEHLVSSISAALCRHLASRRGWRRGREVVPEGANPPVSPSLVAQERLPPCGHRWRGQDRRTCPEWQNLGKKIKRMAAGNQVSKEGQLSRAQGKPRSCWAGTTDPPSHRNLLWLPTAYRLMFRAIHLLL